MVQTTPGPAEGPSFSTVTHEIRQAIGVARQLAADGKRKEAEAIGLGISRAVVLLAEALGANTSGVVMVLDDPRDVMKLEATQGLDL